MLSYFLLYRTREQTSPTGLFVKSVEHAILWDHREKAWVYDPELVARYLDSVDNIDRYRKVDRQTAEQAAPQITGGERLPDEETIRWIFQWRGEPPQDDF
ncbi:MAG TPA: hypothetical protein VF174_04335 [Micromonosporaceae bacterium]